MGQTLLLIIIKSRFRPRRKSVLFNYRCERSITPVENPGKSGGQIIIQGKAFLLGEKRVSRPSVSIFG
jgi:hypothetical protein